MIRQSNPRASRPVASHCDALLRRQASPAELEADLAAVGTRLAPAIRRAVSDSWGDAALVVRCLGTRQVRAGELATICGPLGAASVHAIEEAGCELSMFVAGEALLIQLDRAFGGTGDAAGEPPARLPASAIVLAQRLADRVTSLVAHEFGGTIIGRGRVSEAGEHGQAQTGETAFTLLEFEFSGSAPGEWRVALALETEALPMILPKRRPSLPRPRDANRIAQAPFADLPLEARATLVDMNVPLQRLARLQPGMVLPVMVARQVPIHIGETTIARGTVGEVDDRVALQISQTFSGKDKQ